MVRRPLAAALAALALLAAGCSEAGLDRASRTATTDEAGGPAPDFSVPALDGGGRVALADYAGRPVVLNFWASWCGPCKLEMPDLVAFAEEHPEVAVVGLAVNDAPSDSRRFAERYGVGYDLGIDRDTEVAGEFGATGLPVTVYIDRDGRIVTTHFGTVTRPDLEAFARAHA